jgi:hypothetical protein
MYFGGKKQMKLRRTIDFLPAFFLQGKTLFSCNILRILIGRFQMNGTRVGSLFFLEEDTRYADVVCDPESHFKKLGN